MKNFYLLLLLIAAIGLSGCADSSTKGNVKEVKVPVDIKITNNQGTIYLDPAFALRYAQGDLAQDTSNTSDLNPVTDLKVPIAQGAASAATGAMDAIKNTLDNSLKNSENDNSAVNPLQDIGTGSDPGNITDGKNVTGQQVFNMEYIAEHNRLFVWLPETGPFYGKSFKLSIPVCDTALVVPDSSQNLVTPDMIYFDGTHNKKEESNGVRASVFGPVGCKTGDLVLTSE